MSREREYKILFYVALVWIAIMTISLTWLAAKRIAIQAAYEEAYHKITKEYNLRIDSLEKNCFYEKEFRKHWHPKIRGYATTQPKRKHIKHKKDGY